MRILITGGRGFLGSRFITAAKRQGFTVASMSRTLVGHLDSNGSDYEICGDLKNPPYKTIASFKPDVLVHCAWIATPGVYMKCPTNFDLVDESVKFVQNLINIGVSYFTITGSCIEYAPSSKPLQETSELSQDKSPYVVSKLELLSRIARIARDSSVPYSWCRVFYPYGLGEHPDRLVSVAIKSLCVGREFVVNTPFALRDYIHVSDVVAGMLDIVSHQRVGVFNLGSGYGVRLIYIVQSVAMQLNVNPNLIKLIGDGVNIKNDAVVASVRLKSESKWQPLVAMDVGIKEMISNWSELIE